MSLIDNLRPKAVPKPAQAPDIQRKLESARAELTSLENRHAEAALNAIDGGAEAGAPLEAINRELATVRERITTLAAAHNAAIDRDQAAARAQREALRRTQLNACRKHLDAQKVAAVAFSAAIADAAKNYRALLEKTEKARAACPIGSRWPDAGFGHDQIAAAVRNEMYRLSAIPGNTDHMALPGAIQSGADTQWNPGAITPLPDLVARHAEYIIANLTGKAE